MTTLATRSKLVRRQPVAKLIREAHKNTGIIVGKCYWYKPEPDLTLCCPFCSFLFGEDELELQKYEGRRKGRLVLVLHPTLPNTAHCPSCRACLEIVNPGSLYRVKSLEVSWGAECSDVSPLWLHKASEAEVFNFWRRDELFVDSQFGLGPLGTAHSNAIRKHIQAIQRFAELG